MHKRVEGRLKMDDSKNVLKKSDVLTFIQNDKHNYPLFKNWMKHLDSKNFNNVHDFYRLPPPMKKGKIRPSYIPKEKPIVPKSRRVKVKEITHLPFDDIMDFLIINMGYTKAQIETLVKSKMEGK